LSVISSRELHRSRGRPCRRGTEPTAGDDAARVYRQTDAGRRLEAEVQIERPRLPSWNETDASAPIRSTVAETRPIFAAAATSDFECELRVQAGQRRGAG
jgi:hypothetical protein